MSRGVYVFFFFQAEDGIRDLTVTGVQTLLFRSGHCRRIPAVMTTSVPSATWRSTPSIPLSHMAWRTILAQLNPASWRSEERRVGKECRSRWATYHEKKKERHMSR